MANNVFLLMCVSLIINTIEIFCQKESQKANVMLSTPTSKLNITNSNHALNIPKSESNDSDGESGTVIRGILVFVGIGLIFIVYIACQTYRKKKMPLINKYGVRGNRSDVEMRPLPLDDDEDDETVFDLGSLNKP